MSLLEFDHRTPTERKDRKKMNLIEDFLRSPTRSREMNESQDTKDEVTSEGEKEQEVQRPSKMYQFIRCT